MCSSHPLCILLAQVAEIACPIAGEELAIARVVGGTTGLQHEVRWSGDQQLWWRDPTIGDRLELVLPVARGGRHALTRRITLADDDGGFRCLGHGQSCGETCDLYDAAKQRKICPLGEVALASGDHALVLEVLSPNPLAVRRNLLGLDCRHLDPVNS